MPFKLTGLNLNRVDLCPAGANQGAEIMLFKSEEGTVPQPKKGAKKTAAKKAPAKKADSRSKKKQQADEEEEDEEDDAVNKADDEDEEEEEDDVEKADDDEDEDDDAADDEEEDDEEEEDEKPRRKSSAKKSPTKKSTRKVKAKVDDEDEGDIDDEDEDDEVEEIDEEVLKSMPPKARRILEKALETANEALETATIEKDRRQRIEYIEKAKKIIPNLTGTAEEKGDLLKALYSGKPIVKKTADAIVKLLKAGDKAQEQMLMSDVGRGRARDDDESAYAQLVEARDEIMKSDKKLSREQAMEKACEQNPKLYSQYRVEKRRARRAEADVN